MAPADRTYWAAREPKEMLKEAFRRIDRWFEYAQKRSGLLTLWRDSLRDYYAGQNMAGKIGTEGEQGELLTMKVNHAHNIGEHIVTAVAGQPPTFVPQAQNNDHEATSETDISRVILEAATTQKGVAEVFVQTTRRAWVLGEGYSALEWDPRSGEDYAGLDGRVVKKGDVRARAYSPIDVVRDHVKDAGEDHEWRILRRWENRYDVVARAKLAAKDQTQAREWEDHILSLPSKIESAQTYPRLEPFETTEESDEIAVWELRHKKTDALPQGRHTVFVSPEVLLSDGPCKYRGGSTYVFRMVPEERIGRESGYSPHFDLMAPQQAINAAYSSQLSGLGALGHSVVHSTIANMEPEQLTHFTLLKGPGEVKAISLLAADALRPHSEFADKLVSQMEIVSGVNSVRRGNAASMGASSSGAKLALVDAKFYESIVGLQRAYKAFASAVATAIVELYQDNATVEQTVSVAGKDKRVKAVTFTGEQIKKVLRVEVEMGDPMTRTSSGRLQIAEMLLAAVDPTGKPMIKTPEQFIQVVQTGRLDPLVQGQASELDNIKAENEMLGDGVEPQCFIFDNHPLHFQEHYSVMASPESRNSPQVMTACLAHMKRHLEDWNAAPIDGLAARGIMPPPSMSMMAPPAPGATSGTPPPEPGAPSSSEAPGPPEAGPQPNMPSMPTNPQTGEPAPGPAMV